MIVTVNLSVGQYAQYLAQLGSRAQVAAVRGVRLGAMQGLAIVQRRTSAAGAVHTGAFKQRWTVVREPDGALLHNSAGYASVIERGRRAGSRAPPARALARWAKLKLHLSEEEAERAGFLIARAIAKRGIPGKHILRDATPDLTRAVLASVQRELVKELARKP